MLNAAYARKVEKNFRTLVEAQLTFENRLGQYDTLLKMVLYNGETVGFF